jgi:preprotein translocase subunit SecF
MRFFKDASFKILESRSRAYVASGVLLAVGLISLFAHRGLSYGVDFTGGTLLQVEFEETTTVGELRDILTADGITNAQIQGFGDVNEFLIRIQGFDEGGDGGAVGGEPAPAAAGDGSASDGDTLDSQLAAGATSISEQVVASLEEAFGEGGVTVLRTEAVGPQVGQELQEKAIIAILLSFLLTLIYLAFRFEWRFGVAAVIATVHDITLTFGFISMLEVEITLATVAAILTIVGYSLNDTIVVFDRVRENLKGRRKESYIEVLNRSINETLPRTAMTSLTTLGALIALFLFGGPVIRPFALVLILGVLVGTYSSIFVASPALLEINEYMEKRARTQGASA